MSSGCRRTTNRRVAVPVWTKNATVLWTNQGTSVNQRCWNWCSSLLTPRQQVSTVPQPGREEGGETKAQRWPWSKWMVGKLVLFQSFLYSTVVCLVCTCTATLLFCGIPAARGRFSNYAQHVGNDKNGRLPRRSVGNRRGYFTNNYIGRGVFYENIVFGIAIYFG